VLKATAGLRLLPADRAGALLDEAKNLLAASGFSLAQDGVAILDGIDEGLFSWFTVNFLLGELRNIESFLCSQSSSPLQASLCGPVGKDFVVGSRVRVPTELKIF